MGKFDYATAQSDAVELCHEFGQVMSTEKPDGSQKQSFVGVLLGLTAQDTKGLLIPNITAKVITADTLKRESDDNGDILTINKVKYVILSTDTLRPAGTDVLTTLYVRS